ncbi:SGNH/GDSL hydrolase family protein [Horticoccus sp. 23ND18S-11]|uniref:SGNH/GDSL hydrolase family protein n=1 Tax=Horticoccus sp. 23ND18S-11 TaxID=3391832 RepID=UPI0039C9CD54
MNTLIVFARFRRAFAPVLALGLLFSSLPFAAVAGAENGNPNQPDRNPPFSAIYVIGDSLSDTGRTLAAIGIPPFPYFNGRVSNGPNWIDQLAPQLRLTYNPLDNFSWAGANTGRTNVYTGLPGMLDEVDELLSLYPFPRRLDKKALYVVFGGANDFFRILSGNENPAVVIPQGVANLVTIVRRLSAAGAEHIVVVNLPDIGLTPRARLAGPATSAGATLLSAQFNQLLNGALNALSISTVRVDAFALLNAIAAQPAAFGFTNVTTPGIALFPASADTYLFWDDVHPTTRTHGLFAAAVFDALADAGLLKQLLKHP